MSRSDLNRRLGFPRVKFRWLRNRLYRGFLDWYRRSHFCLAIGSGMQTPLEATFRHLELRGLCPNPLIALEVFGGTGLFKTVDLAKRADHITHIEISESLIHHAKKVLPRGKLRFVNDDAIATIRQARLPRNDYNFVHIDNSCGRIGPDYCENFDLFPDVLECVGHDGVFVFNVWLDIREQGPDSYWLERRREFFRLSAAEDPARIDYRTAERAYLQHVSPHLFAVRDVFPVPHQGETIYMVICVERTSSDTRAPSAQEAQVGQRSVRELGE